MWFSLSPKDALLKFSNKDTIFGSGGVLIREDYWIISIMNFWRYWLCIYQVEFVCLITGVKFYWQRAYNGMHIHDILFFYVYTWYTHVSELFSFMGQFKNLVVCFTEAWSTRYILLQSVFSINFYFCHFLMVISSFCPPDRNFFPGKKKKHLCLRTTYTTAKKVILKYQHNARLHSHV